MPKINKTKSNPFGLSIKQRAVINDMVNDVQTGKGMSPVKSHAKIYPVKNKNVAYQLANRNVSKDNFREALLFQLKENNIIGKNGKVERRLMEGLDAKTTGKFGGEADPKVRLEYIKEINKITGVYAPEKKQTASLKLRMDLTPEQIDRNIEKLTKELGSDTRP